MSAIPHPRTWSTLSIVLVSVLGIVVLALIAFGAFLSSARFPKLLVDSLAARSQRRSQVDGAFEVNFLSSTPSIAAERVTIGNPPWMTPGNTAEIERLTLVFDFPVPWRKSTIRKLEMTGAKLHLIRDDK